MAVFSTIQKSQLEGAKRLDAEYYQPEYLEVRKFLTSSTVLIDVSKKITDFGAYSQMNFVEYTDSGVRFLRNQDVGEFFLQDDDPVFVPEQTYEKLSLKLEEYDIVTPRVGTLGNAAVVFRDQLPASANQNLAQIKPDLQKINPLYLATFLSSRFGQAQFDWLATGNVQPWLNLLQINSIKVFVPSFDVQNNIAQFATRALDVYKESKSLYTQAENLLLEKLRLGDFKADEDLYSIVNFSDIKSVNRMDAEYFQPKYEKIISVSRKHDGKALGELVTVKKGFEPGAGAYEDEGKLFIRVSSVSKHELLEKDQKYINKKLYDELKKEYEPKKGEILLTKDASPGVAYVLDRPVEGIISSGILRLKLKEEINPDYLALCINSVVGQMQVERDAGGSVIAHWKPEQVKSLIVPILPKATQEKIAGLVRESHAARKKAKELLEEAKRKVEELIESKAR